MFIRHLVCTFVAISFSLVATATTNRVDVGEFSKGSLSNWENKSFAGETSYSLLMVARY